jgi:hypothetical protein
MVFDVRMIRPHRSPWRMLGRRCWLHPSVFIIGAIGCIPALCMVVWLAQGPNRGWPAEVMRWLWFLWSAVFALMTNMVLVASWRRGNRQAAFKFPMIVTTLSATLTALFLLFGRLEWAVLSQYGIPALFKSNGCRGSKLRRTLAASALDVGIAAAFILHSTTGLVICLLLAWLVLPLRKPPLREAIAGKLTAAGIAARKQTRCEIGHG